MANTIETYGDDWITDCFIQRTLTEIEDDSVSKVGKNAFYNCTKLTSVNLPAATSIENYAFKGCTKLTSVNLPAAARVEYSAFDSCSALSTLILRKSDAICTLANVDAFKNTPIARGTGYIYVPRELVDTYKTESRWSTYADQFRALEDYTVDGTITGALDETKISA